MADVRTVFISYSWDSDDHKNWVRELAERLAANGVHVHLDQWDVRYGESLTQFMDEKIPESDFVLIVCTPAYAVKATRRQGGVGYEAQIVSARIAAAIPRTKFVPIVRSGALKPGEPDCAIPPHFQRILTLDMREEAKYDTIFENLLRHIYGQPSIKRPPLGSPPDFTGAIAAAAKPVRLARFSIERWELESGVAMNEQYPRTFWLPAEAVRRSLKAGDIVKLMFKYIDLDEEEAGGFEAERMWVEITELNGPYFVGELRNQPVVAGEDHDLAFGSKVVFLPEHVIDMETENLGEPAKAPNARAAGGRKKRPAAKPQTGK